MILGQAEVWNFGSFEHFTFDYARLGLTGVTGRSGAGKSTLCDIPTWIVCGTTSKDGAVDDVRRWDQNEPTKGIQHIHMVGRTITVTRIRGREKQNDLFFVDSTFPDIEVRGKDITETQKKLFKTLGFDADDFLRSAYFTQFNAAGDFFIAKAKDRRPILEATAPLELPVRAANSVSEARKKSKADLSTVQTEHAKLTGKLEQLRSTLTDVSKSIEKWDTDQAGVIAGLLEKSDNFEAEKFKKVNDILARLEVLDGMIRPREEFQVRGDEIRRQLNAIAGLVKQRTELGNTHATQTGKLNALKDEHKKFSALKGQCPKCLGPTDNPNSAAHIVQLHDSIKSLESSTGKLGAQVRALDEAIAGKDALEEGLDKITTDQGNNERYIAKFDADRALLEAAQQSENQYLGQLATETDKVNPFREQRDQLVADIATTQTTVSQKAEAMAKLEHRVASLTRLYDLSFVFRGELLKKAVKQLERSTNRYLEAYFDGALRVAFSLPESDKLEVEIQNNGHVCSFKQLCGGERCMLKLSFWVSLMKASANKLGIHFGNLFFDEALNGLDDSLKVKAFGLFQELENDHESILLVDHCEELKGMFANVFRVTLQGDVSEVNRVGTGKTGA